MEIKVCNNKQEWNKRFLKQEQGLRQSSGQAEFLQSWEWGEFQRSVGREVLRLQAIEGSEVVWQGQGVVHRLGLGMRYLYLPKFSIFNFQFSILVNYLKENYNFSFVRIEPVEQISNIKYQVSSIKNRQPQTTLILDISKTEEELLAQMHPKTRYNIGLAERKGVKIIEEKNIEVFWKLNQETIKRDKFKSHKKDYYEKMLKTDICHQLTAYHNNKPLASNLLIIFGNTCAYLHGASSFDDKNLMAPYLLHWEGIKLAKKMNYKYYDFWGIAPIVEKGDNTVCFHGFCWKSNHKWAGVTRFKAGFGGKVKEYPEAVDIILKPWRYRSYKLVHKILTKY